VLPQASVVRTVVTVLLGTVLGVAVLAALGVGLLVAAGVDLGGNADHAPLEGTEGLPPEELGEQDTPPEVEQPA
jgi:putative effector of murein hydrolase